jgi:hypothetical protein
MDNGQWIIIPPRSYLSGFLCKAHSDAFLEAEDNFLTKTEKFAINKLMKNLNIIISISILEDNG